MMGKTFDEVWEVIKQRARYEFASARSNPCAAPRRADASCGACRRRYARTVLAWSDRGPPPPFNLLALPVQSRRAVRDICEQCCQKGDHADRQPAAAQ
jgi:hypothetical protein